MGRHSIIDKEYIVELWDAGFTAKEIAKRTGYGETTIYMARYEKTGLIHPKNWNYTRNKVKEMSKAGKTQTEIAKELGISRQRVSQIVKTEKIYCDKYRRKLDEQKISDMIQDYKNGRKVKDIRQKYNVSETTIYKYFKKNNVEARERGINSRSIAVSVYKTNGEKVGEYSSITSACISIGIENGVGNVARYLKEGKPYIYGYKWEYKGGNYEPNKFI